MLENVLFKKLVIFFFTKKKRKKRKKKKLVLELKFQSYLLSISINKRYNSRQYLSNYSKWHEEKSLRRQIISFSKYDKSKDDS